MKFEYLREFTTVAHSTQMYEAAEILGISFSSLSKHMKSLEEELGVPLFMRARKVVLTQYGRAMLSYAEELVALQDQYLLEFQSMTNAPVGLTIGISQFQYNGIINDVVNLYQRSNKAQSTVIKEAHNSELPTLVQNGQCDLAFVRSVPTMTRNENLLYFSYCVDRLIACLPTSHPCANQQTVSFMDLKDDTVFLQTTNSTIYNICSEGYAKLGIPLNVSTCGFYATFDNVRNGKGITYYMAPPPQADFGNSLVMIPVAPPIHNFVDIIVCRNNISPQVEAFLQFAWRQIPRNTSAP